MAENGNHTSGGNENGERYFTQSEMDAIIGERLSRERSKYADYDSLKERAGKYDELQENSKTELQKANEKAARLEKELGDLKKTNSVREIREKISGEMKVPAELLTGEDEETCKKQAEAFLKYVKPQRYPDTKPNNRRNTGGHETNESMRDFARQIFGRGE